MFTRAFRADFDASNSEGRIVSGYAIPYNSPTQIFERGRTFSEVWKPGAARDSFAKRGNRVKILGFHDQRSFPLGKPVLLEDRAKGGWLEARISDTRDGNDALTLIRDEVLDGFSVGFTVPQGGDTWSQDGSERTITRAEIHEISIVNFPAFDNARVESIRNANRSDPMTHAFEDENGDGFCDECGMEKSMHSSTMVNKDDEMTMAASGLLVAQRLQHLHLELLSKRITA